MTSKSPTIDRVHPRLTAILLIIFALLSLDAGLADGGVTFTDIATETGSGLAYARQPSATNAVMEELRQQSLVEPLPFTIIPEMPYNTSGQPGVAIFDFDGDSDLDIYVTNGPGRANSLYANQLLETGALRFVDMAEAAGVAATAQDGMGVCFGDTDNDGDDDLLVLGRDEPNLFFENLGDGTFREVGLSGLEAGDKSSPSCAMGDIDNDGLLDVIIGNAYDHGNLLACLVENFALTQHNQLFHNRGDNVFAEVSASSGIEDLTGYSPTNDGGAGITWAVAMVDVDLDGDTDLVFGDDQCGMNETYYGGQLDRGFLHTLINDGSGHFTDQPMLDGPYPSSSWMGLGFGDLNCDGNMDIFGSNFGDYMDVATGLDYFFGQQATRPVFGLGDGQFADHGVGSLGASVFGWGNAVFDYDNDGDLDVAYQGGLDFAVMVPADNPGVVLQNQDCSGEFVLDEGALTTNHSRRIVQGMAVGDLDLDGFVDMVSVSSFDLPEEVPMVLSPAQYGTGFDDTAFLGITWDATPEGFVWRGISRLEGSLSVEISSGGNGNASATFRPQGSVELTARGQVNRSGFGAVLAFTPQGGREILVPAQGGSSFASQHSPELTFGLGQSRHGRLEVLWPGGVRNRLDRVLPGERLTIPEIPCDYAADWPGFGAFVSCVRGSLKDLRRAGVIDRRQGLRHLSSMLRAYVETH